MWSLGVDVVDRLLVKDAVNKAVNKVTTRPEVVERSHEVLVYCLNGGLSIALVLLGGLFAGLTLAFVSHAPITS